MEQHDTGVGKPWALDDRNETMREAERNGGGTRGGGLGRTHELKAGRWAQVV